MAKNKTHILYRHEVNGKIVELVQREAVYEVRLTIPDPGGMVTTIAASILDPSYSNPFIHARHQ